MTAKRWRTESAKAGHDAEERRDSDEERRDDVEKRRDSEDVVVNDVDDAKGLGTQRWFVVSGREQKLCCYKVRCLIR